jgi:hypothetical protein
LCLITGSLEGTDKTSVDYLTRVRWAFRVVGVGFLVVASLQAGGVVGYGLAVAIPLNYAAGVGFLLLAQRARGAP